MAPVRRRAPIRRAAVPARPAPAYPAAASGRRAVRPASHWRQQPGCPGRPRPTGDAGALLAPPSGRPAWLRHIRPAPAGNGGPSVPPCARLPLPRRHRPRAPSTTDSAAGRPRGPASSARHRLQSPNAGPWWSQAGRCRLAPRRATSAAPGRLVRRPARSRNAPRARTGRAPPPLPPPLDRPPRMQWQGRAWRQAPR